MRTHRGIIAFGYKARSGKDTAAKVIEASHGFRPVALADPLKAAARELFGLTPAQLHGDRKETVDEFWGVTPRNIMQRLGTEAMRREFGDDFWIRALKRRIDTAESNVGHGLRWVVTDVRFMNEAQAVKSWGGTVIRIDRPGAGATGGVAQHPSEAELDAWSGWDAVIQNTGTLDELATLVRAVAEEAVRTSGRTP